MFNSDRRNFLGPGHSDKSFATNLSSRGFLQNPVIDQINVFGGKDSAGDHTPDLSTNLHFVPVKEVKPD